MHRPHLTNFLFGRSSSKPRFSTLGSCLSTREMAPFAMLATTITHEHIQKKSTAQEQPSHQTPVLSLSVEAQNKGYQAICLPLTTGKWRERWRNMCIMPSTGTASNEEVIVAEKAAEVWRKSPSFLLDEVTITRLGKPPSSAPTVPCVRCATHGAGNGQMRRRSSWQWHLTGYSWMPLMIGFVMTLAS